MTTPDEQGQQGAFPLATGSEVPIPTVKRPLVLMRCPNPRALHAVIGTAQAMTWIKKNECYFDSMTRLMIDTEKRMPASTTLIIPECYDMDEVTKYLASPEWATLI